MDNHAYIEWICHTNFSFLYGASHPSECLDTATRYKLHGLAITDFDGVYGLAKAYSYWQKLECPKPNLFYGAEIHLTKDHQQPLLFQNTIVLIARSALGYKNLCCLLTLSHRQGKRDAFITLEDFSHHDLKDLTAIVPMRGLIRHRDASPWRSQLKKLKDLFGTDLLFCISRHFNPAEDVWIPRQIEAAKLFNNPLIFSQDIFFHGKERKFLSDTLHAIRLNQNLKNCVNHMFVNDARTFIHHHQFKKHYGIFDFYQKSMEASRQLAEACQFSFKELRYQYPKEMIPDGFTAQTYMEFLVNQRVRHIYGENIPFKISHMLQHEIKIIKDLEFADYFLTVWDIVSWAKSQNILYQGRGSAANSSVCFFLGITVVDPERFDLLFERFMSKERGDPPDIDVDFEHERREEVIQYIYERYGRKRAAMVANVITFRRKGALRAAGKALGIPEVILGSASDFISSRIHVDKSLDEIANALKKDYFAHHDLPWLLWIDVAEALRGFPRHLGIHSGGFIIADRPLDELVPQEPATMEGRTVIQWCKDDMEDLGFFKIDMLALGMLTAVRKTFSLLKQHYNKDLDFKSIPSEDPNTYAMIQQADTVGTFQIESRAQMSMLPCLKPKTFYDLVIEVAIVRPGPIQGGMVHPYLKRRHGLEPVSFPDERLRPILQRTLGIPIFQEQVMQIAIALGDFTPGEANELRKNMGAWSMRGDIHPWLQKLSQGFKKNGVDPDFGEAILEQMKGFAEYGFPESHAVSFALIAYTSAYLKCHYPAAFFTALLNSQPMGFYSPHTLIQTARREGVNVLPVCIQKSNWDTTLEKTSQSEKPAIRLGFRLVRGLSETAGKHIESARLKYGIWKHWECFLKQTSLFRHDLTALAAANAFYPLGLDRRAAIWMAAAAPHSKWLEDVESELIIQKSRTKRLPEDVANLQMNIQQDFHSTGTTLLQHPSQFMREKMWCFTIPVSKMKRACELNVLIPRQMVHVFGVILIKQRPPSAKGMMFITLEDETGFINLVFTPQVTQKFASLLHGVSVLCVLGTFQRQGHSHSILVKTVYPPLIEMAQVISIKEGTSVPSMMSKNIKGWAHSY